MTSIHRPRSRLTGSILALAIAAGLALAASPPASAEEADGVDGIAGAPAAAGDADRTRSRLSYQLDPGQRVEDEYFVRNTGTTVQDVTVFATDAFTTADGSYSLEDTAVEPTDVGSWVTFEGGATQVGLTLQPGESRILPFTLTVPPDAGPGDHAGGMVVSAVTAGQVQLDRRVATRLYARIRGELQAALSITSITASYAPELNPFSGTTTVTYTVTNSGNVSLGADSVATVRGLFGIPLSAPQREELSELLPGDTRTLNAVVPGVGQWVFLNPTVSLAATIDEDALNPGPLPSTSRDVVVFVVPWALLAALLLALLVWLWVRASRRRDAKRAREWIEFTEAEARRKAAETEPSEPTSVG